MFVFSLRRSVPAIGLCTALFLAGCSASTDSNPMTAADAVTVSEQWVKAADTGMTAAFATLSNNSDTDVRLVAVTSPAATRMELHEIATGIDGTAVMREKADGVVVPAEGSHALVPGGDHLMLMGITAPLAAGTTATFTFTFADGSTTTVDAQVRDFAGNQENYEPADAHDAAPSSTPAGHGG